MMYFAYKLNKQGDNIQPDVLLFLFGTSPLVHVQLKNNEISPYTCKNGHHQEVYK